MPLQSNDPMNADAVSKEPEEKGDLLEDTGGIASPSYVKMGGSVEPEEDSLPNEAVAVEDSTTSDDDSSSPSLDSSDSWNLVAGADNANNDGPPKPSRDHQEASPKVGATELRTSLKLARQFTQLTVDNEKASMETENSKTESLLEVLKVLTRDFVGSDASVEALGQSLQVVLQCEKILKLDGAFFGGAVQQDPANAVKFLAACDKSDESELFKVAEAAMDNIRSEPKILLDENAETSLGLLSPGRVEALLRDDKMAATESTLFRILRKWLKSASSGSNPADREILEKKAREMLKNIKMDGIHPNALGTEVLESGLATEKQLLEAYVVQSRGSLRSAWDDGRRPLTSSRYEITRKNRVSYESVLLPWYGCNHSSSACIDFKMKWGKIHKWRFYVERLNSDHGNCDIRLGIQPSWAYGTWSCGNNGSWWIQGNASRPFGDGLLFQKGSTCSFEFNMTDPSNATLSASFDGKPMLMLFSEKDLNIAPRYDTTSTCRVAASVNPGAAVKFLGFDDE